MNLQSNECAANKGFAEDLSDEKFSFLIVHGILQQPENQLIMSEFLPLSYSISTILSDVLQKRSKTPISCY
ncbi:hypothetical protein BDR07DRAFT_342613 [Suillus spraguei]|nr:hypothetical protein BDR07DRAFT_342613 [Suillus spraguei]